MTDVGNSAIALGISPAASEKDKVHLIASAGTRTSPAKLHAEHHPLDLRHLVPVQLDRHVVTKAGNDSWYFITADYAFGHAIERDTTRFVEAAGGKVLGASRYPLQTTDFSAFLLQAQATRPR